VHEGTGVSFLLLRLARYQWINVIDNADQKRVVQKIVGFHDSSK
jgi:hypothetical protein